MECVVCKKPAKDVCSSCKNVAYCSVTCQKSDWKIHKKSCSPFVIQKRDDGTEYFEATRDIQVGTIICDETPIFQLPFNGKPICCCLSCSFPIIAQDKSRRCSGCGWPICSSQCTQLPIHKENECEFFSSNKIKFSPEADMHLPMITAGIRAFTVKKNNPELWDYLQNLGLDNMKQEKLNPNHFGTAIMHNLRKNKEKNELEEGLKTGYKLLNLQRHKGFVRFLTQYAVAFSYIETAKLSNFSSTPNVPRYRGYYLYVKAGKMAHSCSPNTIWHVGDAPGFKLRLRAIAPISKGEEMTLSRINDELEEGTGTIERRKYIKENRGIDCKCARCCSPSEFETYISAIRCNFCLIRDSKENEKAGKKKKSKSKSKSKSEVYDKNSGYFLPVDPLVSDKSGQNILFKCNRCSEEIRYSEFLPKINEISRELKDLTQVDDDRSCYLVGLKNFIETYSSFLHPNHYIFQYAHFTIIDHLRIETQKLTNKMRQLDPFTQQANLLCEDKIQDGIQRCYFLLNIFQKIVPGFSTRNAKILANLTTLKLQHVKLTAATILTPDGFNDQRERIKEMIQELDVILAYYKDDLPSHRVYEKCDQYNWFVSQRNNLEKHDGEFIPLEQVEKYQKLCRAAAST